VKLASQLFSSGADCYFLLQDGGFKFKAFRKHDEELINPPGTRGWDARGSFR
jgi:hypothetical protein